jgi:hypothetical protein
VNKYGKRIAYCGAVLALLSVFSLYLRPDFLLTIANQMWACF